MSASTKLFIEQNSGDSFIGTAVILDAVKHSVNELIQESYDSKNIYKLEINERIPLIRNAARINNFICRPHVEENSSHLSFHASFCFFVNQDEENNFPQYDFKNKKEGSFVYHQHRTIYLSEENNSDILNYFEDLDITNKVFFSVSMNNDIIGQSIIESLSKKLKEKLETEVLVVKNA